MVAVYMPGVWDMLHVGHLNALETASRLGNFFIVGVPTDEVVFEDKGELPIIPFLHRIRMIESLRFVNRVESYDKLEFLQHLNRFKPEILAVSEQWGNDQRHKDAEQWVKDNERRLIKIPYYSGESTTRIKQRVLNQYLQKEI